MPRRSWVRSYSAPSEDSPPSARTEEVAASSTGHSRAGFSSTPCDSTLRISAARNCC